MSLRAATMADAPMLLRWRNDDAARLASSDVRSICLQEHLRWLAGALDDPLRCIYVAEVDGCAVGSVRAEAECAGASWRLSWVIDPAARGRGHGRAMLQLLLSQIEGDAHALIAVGNSASEAIARHAGMCPQPAGAGRMRLWTRDRSASQQEEI